MENAMWRQAVVLGVVCILYGSDAQANQPPIFRAGMDYLQIPEDTAIGATVYTLSATDADGDILTYGVSGQVSNNLFMVDPSSGVVTLKTALDREHTDEYQITVTVEDGTNPVVQQNPTIFITDANDNSPVFQGIPYEVDVKENDMLQTSIFRVTATDADQGIGGTVSYFLEAGDETKFEVDRPTGVVNLREALDYESSSVYQLRIRAQDGGGSLNGSQVFQSSTTVLIVNVVDDEDDQPPVFLYFAIQVDKNTPLGTSIITINARDGDYGINNPIVFSTEGDDGTFSIDSTTGVISLAKTLDIGVYSFDVQARENSSVARSTNTSVRITVVDVNGTSADRVGISTAVGAAVGTTILGILVGILATILAQRYCANLKLSKCSKVADDDDKYEDVLAVRTSSKQSTVGGNEVYDVPMEITVTAHTPADPDDNYQDLMPTTSSTYESLRKH